jgi:hypothetical protein
MKKMKQSHISFVIMMLSPGALLYAARSLLGWWFKQDTAHFLS